MQTPFVGRTRELRHLTRWLDQGRNIVLTGPFGSGRTTLVRRLAEQTTDTYRFVWLPTSGTRREMRRALDDVVSTQGPRVVAVLDDVARLTSPKLTFLRKLVPRGPASWIVIVERSLDDTALLRLRAALGAAPLVRLGPLSFAEVEQYVAACIRTRGLRWSTSEIRACARASQGFPLIVRWSMDAALRVQNGASQTPPAQARRPRHARRLQ